MKTNPEKEVIAEGRRLLTVAEVAQRLGVKPQTIRNWMCQGKCPVVPVMIGKAVRFREIDVDRITG